MKLSRLTSYSGILIATIFLLFTQCTQPPKPEFFQPGIPQELADMRVQQLQKIHYDLRFNIPAEPQETIAGDLTLTFDFQKGIDDYFFLDFNADPTFIERVLLNGAAIEYEVDKEHIVLPTKEFEPKNKIEIKFTVGETGLNRREGFMYTLFVPDRASSVFPCFDQPNLKATFKLTLEVPSGWEAISNGPLLSQTANSDREIFAFDISDVMSTYLFSFAAGEFEKIVYKEGKYPMTMYHRESDSSKVADNVNQIFKLHDESLRWLEDYTGIDYPFKKFDFVLIPGFQYGGMEHVGAIQYRASSLFLEPSATNNQLLSRASLIAHETAHMWFGNLVTMEWFNDVWMKEVFANFMAAKIINPQFPDINHDLRFLLAHYPRAYSVDRTKGTHPIRQPLENLKQAGTLYGAIIYQKAPIIMRKLEQLLEENNFKAGIQEYLKTYTFGNASWLELIKILDTRTEEDLDKWSKIWVESSGRPVVRTEFLEGAEENLLQLSMVDPTDANNVWPQEVSVGFRFEDGVTARSLSFRDLPTITAPIRAQTIRPVAITVNTDGQFYGAFDYGNTIKLTDWPFSYPLLNTGRINDPVTRGAQYLNVFEYFLYKMEFSPDYPLHLERFLFRESDPLNAELLLDHIETVYWRWLPSDMRVHLMRRYEIMLDQMIKITEDEKLRKSYFESLVSLMSSEEQIVAMLAIWRDQKTNYDLKLSESDFTRLALELALRLPEEAQDILETQRDRITNPDRKARFEFIMPALDNDRSVRDAFFQSLLDPANRTQEAWVNTALRYLHHPLRASSSIAYLEATLAELEEIQMTGDIFFPTGWLSNSFWGHQSEEALAIVQDFLAKNPEYNDRLKNKILQATDMLERSVIMQMRTDLSSLSKAN